MWEIGCERVSVRCVGGGSAGEVSAPRVGEDERVLRRFEGKKAQGKKRKKGKGEQKRMSIFK